MFSVKNTEFEGATVLITGAASGIGLATAKYMAAHGAKRLILVDLDGATLDALAFDVATDRIAGDVADEALWAALDLGALDHAVVNEGSLALLPLPKWLFPNGGASCR